MNKNDENYVYYLVGQNLKRIRKSKHFTITKFAMECNYSEGFIMNIESPNYKQTFSYNNLKICAFYNYTLNMQGKQFYILLLLFKTSKD